jgi:hypothetical protein
MGPSHRFEAMTWRRCCAAALFACVGVPLLAQEPSLRVSPGVFDMSKTRTLGLKQLPSEVAVLYKARKDSYQFCHHPNLVRYGKRLLCMWSNGKVGEDEAGQRILFSASENGRDWSEPRVLASDPLERGACVAAGWVVNGQQVVAMYTVTGGTNFDGATALWARTSSDGKAWSSPQRLVPGFFISAPIPVPGGGLLLAGEHVGSARTKGRMAMYLTRKKNGLSGWTLAKIPPGDLSVFGYTEPAPFVLANGRVVSPFRNYSGTLYASHSDDGGKTWSLPLKTNFPDSLARHATGRLPDGQYFLINNASSKRLDRSILTLALSKDGRVFDRAWIVKNAPTTRRFDGKHKLDGWQYPHAVIFRDFLHVAYSINKEDVGVARIDLQALSARH